MLKLIRICAGSGVSRAITVNQLRKCADVIEAAQDGTVGVEFGWCNLDLIPDKDGYDAMLDITAEGRYIVWPVRSER